MNNNLYGWHDEHMVRYEMHEVDRAVEQARLLREAGLVGPSWLSRAVHSLGNLLKARSKGFKEQRPREPKVLPRRNLRSA